MTCNNSALGSYEPLKDRLVNLIGHMQILRYHIQLAHWQTHGPWFISWHEMFGTQYEQLDEMIDTLAEHVRYRHGRLPSTLLAAIKDYNEVEFPDDGGQLMLNHLKHMTKKLLTHYEHLMKICAESDSQTTLDILIEQARFLEKMVWFYCSSSGPECCYCNCHSTDKKNSSSACCHEKHVHKSHEHHDHHCHDHHETKNCNHPTQAICEQKKSDCSRDKNNGHSI
jgi:starvation-inducible DNA-binding protein